MNIASWHWQQWFIVALYTWALSKTCFTEARKNNAIGFVTAIVTTMFFFYVLDSGGFFPRAGGVR